MSLEGGLVEDRAVHWPPPPARRRPAPASHARARGHDDVGGPLRVDQLHDADDVPAGVHGGTASSERVWYSLRSSTCAIEERPQQVVGVGVLDVQRGAGQGDVRRQARLAQGQRPGLQAAAQLAGANARGQGLVLHHRESQVVVVHQEDGARLGPGEQARLLQDVVEHGLHAQLGAERRRDPDERILERRPVRQRERDSEFIGSALHDSGTR